MNKIQFIPVALASLVVILAYILHLHGSRLEGTNIPAESVLSNLGFGFILTYVGGSFLVYLYEVITAWLNRRPAYAVDRGLWLLSAIFGVVVYLLTIQFFDLGRRWFDYATWGIWAAFIGYTVGSIVGIAQELNYWLRVKRFKPITA